MAPKKAAKVETSKVATELSPAVRERLSRDWQIVGGSGEPWVAGMAVEGQFVEVIDSQFTQDDGEHAKLVTLLVDGSRRTFRCPAVLLARLESVGKGDDVFVECVGKVRTKAGRNAWGFTVLRKPGQGSLEL